MSVKIIVDSSSDIGIERAKELGLIFKPMKTYFGEKEFLDGINLTHTQFYDMLENSGYHPTTSQITPFEYEEIFKEATADGSDAVYIALSSKFSGSCNNAKMVAEDFDGKVFVIDSFNVAVGEQLLILDAVKMRDEGKTAKEIYEVLQPKAHKARLVAVMDTLKYLKKGGRISAAEAIAGELLNIKPVVTVEKGAVATLGKARGQRKGLEMLRSYIDKFNPDFSDICTLAYTGVDPTGAELFLEQNADLFENFGFVPTPCTIGGTIGTHIGPGTVAIAFYEK